MRILNFFLDLLRRSGHIGQDFARRSRHEPREPFIAALGVNCDRAQSRHPFRPFPAGVGHIGHLVRSVLEEQVERLLMLGVDGGARALELYIVQNAPPHGVYVASYEQVRLG